MPTCPYCYTECNGAYHKPCKLAYRRGLKAGRAETLAHQIQTLPPATQTAFFVACREQPGRCWCGAHTGTVFDSGL